MFTFQKVAEAGASVGRGMRIEGIATEVEVAKFDLSLGMVETGGEVVGTMEYATELYDRSRIERMVGQLERVLEEMSGEAEKGVREIEVLRRAGAAGGGVEQHGGENGGEQSVQEMFERQAKLDSRRPDSGGVLTGRAI